MKTLFNKPTKAFSIIELLIVVTIIGILSSALIFPLLDSISDANIATIEVDLKNIVASATLYHMENENSFEGLCNNTDHKKGQGAKPILDKYEDKLTTQAECTDDVETWATAIAIIDSAVGGGSDSRAHVYCIDSIYQNVKRIGGNKTHDIVESGRNITKSKVKDTAFKDGICKE